MEESRTSMEMGMDCDHNEIAVQAVADRERYIREFLKNNHTENK